jgi:hypothetical protein
MNINIYDITERKTIIASNVGLGYIVAWNGQHTLNLYIDRFYTDGQDGCWTEVDVRTLSDVPADVFEAREQGQRWLSDIVAEAEENTR